MSFLKSVVRTVHPAATTKCVGRVVLIGWLLCKPEHLHGVQNWYTSQSYDTISIAPKPHTPLPKLCDREAERILEKMLLEFPIAKNKEEDVPLFFHVFSGQGSIVLASILHRASTDPRYASLLRSNAGIIYDSIPYPLDLRSGRRAMMSILYDNIFRRIFFYYPMFSIYGLMYYFGRRTAERFENRYMQALIGWEIPRAFFHALDDATCPYEPLEQLVTEKQNSGLPMEWVPFEKAGHVEIWRFHRSDYQQKLTSFLNSKSSSRPPLWISALEKKKQN